MGDGWQHTIKLEKIETGGETRNLKCIDGKRSAPHEDCGGIGGYTEIIHHLKHPELDGYIELLEWLGEEYDPEKFDLKKVNRELKKLGQYIEEYEE